VTTAFALVALSLVAGPTGAQASGGYSLSCQGSSTVFDSMIRDSTVRCTRSGISSDDDGPYQFSYGAGIDCWASGGVTVSVTGGEMQIGPASGSYVGSSTAVHVAFSYFALERSTPPAIETHTVALDIDCFSGAATGTLSE
jgi:hypothetical protein